MNSCSPEGKKFRSRNELAKHFQQIRSNLNSEDFDFSVKGKGHHNKGKTPTKKGGEASEGSKENQQQPAKGRAKSVTPASAKRKTPSKGGNSSTASTPATNDRPKRQLRKRLKSNDPEDDVAAIAAAAAAIPPSPTPEDEELTEDGDDKAEVSNVKLKVKVGYTATGAMIRPSTNGGRKKKRRFRNMNVKKSPPAASTTKNSNPNNAKVASKSPSTPGKLSSPVTSTDAADDALIIQEETKKAAAAAINRNRKVGGKKKRKAKGKATEPVAGPSGLQKIKRSPRRILKRKSGPHHSEDDDEDDADYFSSLYPKHDVAEPGSQSEGDPLKINDDDIGKSPNGATNGLKDGSPTRQTRSNHHLRQRAPADGSPTIIPPASSPPINGAVDPLSTSLEDTEVGPMVAMEQSAEEAQLQLEEVETESACIGDNMQVVVIGDSVEALHNYAKPHAV